MSARDDVIDTLNDLIETSHDGEYGFRELAERAQAPELKQTFQRRAEEIRASVSDLEQAVTTQGGTPEDGGTASGALHRGWVAVRSKLTTATDLSLLEEAERGEDSALARYRKAAQKDLPAPVRALVEQQLQGVQRNHDQIKLLRDRQKQMS
ncbi:PA2169 family four-helix-bundle protein [Xylophilus rhododendri]|uniref:PA2169 family four-helix-bundle protein n=1 Tax=Xylophilus rhododendri TaxID=2697032 RepID=A0A857J8C5_9BURK|nr:PA2169 family four-helix-bundle protein [Xylophilus rhododendri]QHI99028.1 PA2169 family four-helix-bundle protein [Xylophilus rhododendri]